MSGRDPASELTGDGWSVTEVTPPPASPEPPLPARPASSPEAKPLNMMCANIARPDAPASSLKRRSLFASVPGLALAATPALAHPDSRPLDLLQKRRAALAAGQDADAVLVGWCGRMAEVAQEYEDLCVALSPVEVEDAPPDVAARFAQLNEEEDQLRERIFASSATTPEGWRALARLMLHWQFLRDCDLGDELGAVLCRSLLTPDHTGFLAELDAATAARRGRYEAAQAERAASPPPPVVYDDTRKPEQRVESSRHLVRAALKVHREAQACMRDATAGGT